MATSNLPSVAGSQNSRSMSPASANTLAPLDESRLDPVGSGQAVALLASCLMLVKPVGMSDADAQGWLNVAAGEVEHLPLDILQQGCSAARRTCTHHGQIVPAILREAEDWLATRRRIFGEPVDHAPADAPKLAAPPPWLPTPEELDQIKFEAAERLRAR